MGEYQFEECAYKGKILTPKPSVIWKKVKRIVR